jgi:hypothetical protein
MIASTKDLFKSMSRILLTRETRRFYEQGRSTEGMLRYLREHGANQVESAIALRDAIGISWDTARRDVDCSMAWFPERASNSYSILWSVREEDIGPPQPVIWDGP